LDSKQICSYSLKNNHRENSLQIDKEGEMGHVDNHGLHFQRHKFAPSGII